MLRGVTLLLALVVSDGAVAQKIPELSNPQIEIIYRQPAEPALLPVQERLKHRQVLEQLKQFLAPLKLPRRLMVQFDQCSGPTRMHVPAGPATVCYELVDEIERVAAKASPDEREMVLVGTVAQAVLHEVAHAVFDLLQVPIWGRSQDAADMLVAFVVLQFGEDVARHAILGTTRFWMLSGGLWTGSAFAAQGSPEAQRYYNYLCIAYGGMPQSFEHLVAVEEGKRPILPEKRAVRCQREYQQFRKAFDLRIMPYIDPDLLVAIRAQPWLVTR